MATVTIGVDVGQRVDPTAIAVCELVEDRFIVRYLERLPLGTSYPQVADRIRVLFENTARQIAPKVSRERLLPMDAALEEARECVWLRVDATGVGTPVIELLRERIPAVHITGVFFTHGDRCAVYTRGREGTLGKAYLVSRLQALIQSRRIALPDTEEARVLADELLTYEIRVGENANDRYGAFKVGTHDDLVTALGLAVLLDAEQHTPMKAFTIRRIGR